MRLPENQVIRIVLLEDHVLLRDMLARTLAAEPDMEVAGQFSRVEDAVELITRERVDIVLLDINLGAQQGGEFLNRARAAGYRGKVLVVTAGVSEREAAWLLQRGCAGIFLKELPPSALIERIRRVVGGEDELDPDSVKGIVSQLRRSEAVTERLSARECLVLRRICEGHANKEIGAELGVSESSVKAILQQIFAKTGVRTRAQLVAAAIERYWDQLN